MKLLRLSAFLILIVPVIAIAQSKKIPVAVVHDGNDLVGPGVAFALKEAIRGSQGFFLVDHEPVPKKPRILVRLVSVGSQTTGGTSAIASVVVYQSLQTPAGGILIFYHVAICDPDRAEDFAKFILPGIDEGVETLRRLWPALWQTL